MSFILFAHQSDPVRQVSQCYLFPAQARYPAKVGILASTTMVVNGAILPTPRRHLITFGDNWDMLLASSEQRPGVLLIYYAEDSTHNKIIIWPQMLPVSRLRNPDWTGNLMFFSPNIQRRQLISEKSTLYKEATDSSHGLCITMGSS